MAVNVVKRETVQGAVYQILKDGIMSLKLAPGTTMSAQEMATRLNVSRTPVREAFIRLQEEGLVDIVPQKETVVSRIDLNRVKQERFIRRSLELAAITPFLENCADADIAAMRGMTEELKGLLNTEDPAAFLECDNRFHRQIFVTAKQELAWDFLQTVNGHDSRYRVLSVSDEKVRSSTWEEHLSMVAFIEAKDHTRMTDLLQTHLYRANLEIPELMKTYPDYFSTEETPGLIVGSL